MSAGDQMPLFGRAAPKRPVHPAPLAAASDPQSSHLAAQKLVASGRLDSQKSALIEWLRSQAEPLTSAEISRASGFDRYMVARRLPDIARGGLVERCPIRECRATGSQAITWRAVREDGCHA